MTATNPRTGNGEADAATLPTDELISLMEHEAYRKVRTEMERMEFVSLDGEGTLHINRNTPWEKTLTLTPGGEAQSNEEDVMEMPIRAPGNPVFKRAWNNLMEHAAERVREHATAALGPEALTLTGEDSPARSALNNTARGICSHTGMGYVRNATQAGDHLLHQLLGKEKVCETLQTAGMKANLRHFNLMARNREALLEAHRQNPNAVTLWMNAKPQDEPASSLNPRTILQEAQELVEKSLPDGEARVTPKGLWKSFTSLNRKAVNDCPEPETLLHAALAAARAGAQPTHTAMMLMAQRGNKFQAAPESLQTAFIREGRRCLERNTGRQGEVTRTMESLLDLGASRLNRQNRNSWSEWRNLAGGQPQPEPPQSGRRSRGQGREEQMRNQQKLDEAIRQNLRRIAEQADRAVKVTAKPGKRATLSGPQGNILTVEKRPSGTVRITANGYFCGHLALPEPRKDGENGNITTRGAAAKLAGELAWETVRNLWEQEGEEPPSVNRVRAAYQRAAAQELPEEELERNDDLQLTQALQDALRSILDPEAWERARSNRPAVSPEEYNRQVQGMRAQNRRRGAWQNG